MRARMLLLVLAILAVGGFAYQNWSAIMQSSTLSFGVVQATAPLGLILLTLLGLTLLLFLVTTATMRSRSLHESRQLTRDLHAQRELADKAEASRFVDLRNHMDTQLRELRERETIAASEFEKSRMESQREIRTQLEQINRTLAARLNELESRLDGRLGAASGTPVSTVRTAPVVHEHPQALDARETQMREEARLRDEERLRDERMREESPARREERATAAERPAESGWRRWF